MSGLEINTELVLSTSHVTAEECNDNPFTDYSSDEHNVRFHVTTTLMELRDTGLDDQYINLRYLLVIAGMLDCKWLVLDSDGETHKYLKTFDL